MTKYRYARRHIPTGKIMHDDFNATHHYVFQDPDAYSPNTMANVIESLLAKWNRYAPTEWRYSAVPHRHVVATVPAPAPAPVNVVRDNRFYEQAMLLQTQMHLVNLRTDRNECPSDTTSSDSSTCSGD